MGRRQSFLILRKMKSPSFSMIIQKKRRNKMAFQIEWIPSRFFDPGKIANQMIIVHHTGSRNGQINSFQGTINWFKPAEWRTSNQVSAQYIIARIERPIVQMVRDLDTAWHAGKSEWVINGVRRKDLNDRSIGIELQGDGNLVP
ncbi:hypothetical protein GF337_19435, partial [candidate division KSB1 bacterium]|nr:hypothetical protein [candidate division KSB1 bacterium]